MVPMLAQKRKEAVHERLYSTPWKVCGRNEDAWMIHGDAGAFFIRESPSSAALGMFATFARTKSPSERGSVSRSIVIRKERVEC